MPKNDDEFDILDEIREAKHDKKSLSKVLSRGDLNDYEMDMLMLDEE